jgi:hypothetical protein
LYANRVLLCIQEGLHYGGVLAVGAGGLGTPERQVPTWTDRLRLRSYLFYSAALYGPTSVELDVFVEDFVRRCVSRSNIT